MTYTDTCYNCEGIGKIMTTCEDCKGTGKIIVKTLGELRKEKTQLEKKIQELEAAREKLTDKETIQ